VVVENDVAQDRPGAFVVLDNLIYGIRTYREEGAVKAADLENLSGAFAVDFNDGKWLSGTLTGDANITGVTVPEAGEYKLILDNTGGHAFSIPAAARIGSLTPGPLGGTAGIIILKIFSHDGTIFTVDGEIYT
jgi:hypothetical protein